jgi:hypothetical protein
VGKFNDEYWEFDSSTGRRLAILLLTEHGRGEEGIIRIAKV